MNLFAAPGGVKIKITLTDEDSINREAPSVQQSSRKALTTRSARGPKKGGRVITTEWRNHPWRRERKGRSPMKKRGRRVKQFRGLFFPWLMLPLQVSLASWWSSYSKEHDMAELITTLILFVNDTLLYWVPFLVGIGYALKHCTKLPNTLIPLVEVALGGVVGLLFGLATYADGTIDALSVISFVGQGALIGVIAIALYDMVHGVLKQKRLCCSKEAAKESTENEKT
jgi:hypothetical protein